MEPCREEDLSPHCSVCGEKTATVRLVSEGDAWRFIYAGPGGGNGNGDLVTGQRADALRVGFTPPHTTLRVAVAELYDDGGFCRPCSRFYCCKHWRVSDGAGRCPAGHFKSLDPHWHPDD